MWNEEFEITLHQFALSVDEMRDGCDFDFDDPDMLDLICGEWEGEDD
jgi:hypothetical protein